MRSPNTQYNPAVDQLRGLAALLILYYHAHSNLLPLISRAKSYSWPSTLNPLYAFLVEGHTAVAFFMVLSGFIFTQAAFGRSIVYGSFLLNRFLRIYPLMLSILAFAIVTHPEIFNFTAVLRWLLLFLSFPAPVLNRLNVLGAPLQISPWTDIFWTIIPEFQFYFLFPVLLRALNRSGVRVIFGSVCLTVFLRLGMMTMFRTGPLTLLWYYSIVGRIDQFLIGMAAAVFWSRSGPKQRAQIARLLPLSGILVLLTLTTFNQLGGGALPADGGWRVIWPTIEAVMWASFIVTFVASGGVSRRSFGTILTRIGEISFSIYLLHWPLLQEMKQQLATMLLGSPIGVISRWPVAATLLIATVFVAPVTLGLSFITFRLIEKPFLKMRVQYLSQPPAAVRLPADALTSVH
jgi:peptidoglycan/LPS O-acetylase OafA/YrhL